ncbi:MAG: ABC transporter ATP-binding protein [Gammaproteobacteria bacterium]|jgi:lipoprotein-releasing system ATP-binding protein|nr:ABC transporter ATP-binding protein [Gammaproteobacteria bacterium]
MLICKNICKAYDDGNTKVSILNNLNLEIKSGESISIIGASGSGKSTLLHVLSSLDRADSGDIILDNLFLSEINENELCKIRLRKIGFIYQFHHLINELTVKENIALPLMIDKKNKSEISSSVNKVIEQVDLKKRENFQIEKLSGGERQRVAIARSIVHDPKIIFADEPTGNLDKNNARNIFALLNDLANYNKSSLLMATHDLDIASKLNKSLILENGTLIEGNI